MIEKDYDNKVVIFNEVIRDNFRPFFTKRFYTHKMQTSEFHSDVFIRTENIKKETSNFHS